MMQVMIGARFWSRARCVRRS